MAAKMNVLRLILSSSPYLRCALRGRPFNSTIDKLAKMVYSDRSLVYKYKGVTEVPPLEMVDDILTISKCSIAAVTINAVVNAFIESKKLTLSKKKCSVIHVGKGGGKLQHIESSWRKDAQG